MTGRSFVIAVLAIVVAGCGDHERAAPITRADLPAIFDVRPGVPHGFRRSAETPGTGFFPPSALGDEDAALRRFGATAVYGRSWNAPQVDVDAIDLGVLFRDDSGARRAHDYFQAQLQVEERWTFTDLEVGDASYCASYDDIAGFAQVSCSWRRRNLVLSSTMIADDERDFEPEDVEAHAEAIDAVARTR